MLTHEREHVLAGHRWRFQRAGGYDHVCLDTGADLVALPTLDQKLWAALACPTRGVEFDARTLDLIDTDADGRIRAPEVLAAVDWALARLRDPDTLLAGGEALALGAIDTRHEDGPDSGRLIHACACEVLRQLGRAEAGTIELDDVADTHRLYATIPFNGDGVITAAAAGDDEALRAALLDVLQVCGGSQSFNAVNTLRVLGRWMRMFTIPNQSSVPKAYDEFHPDGRMKDSPYRDRLVDVMEELWKFTLLTRDVREYLVDRYSERREAAAKAPPAEGRPQDRIGREGL